MNWQPIEAAILDATGEPFKVVSSTSVGGGCINTAYHLGNGEKDYFVKINTAALRSMFEAEMTGLAAMADTGTIRVPRPVAIGESDGNSWLVMEYVSFGHAGSGNQALAGEQLAAMHRSTADQFGWLMDNTIGSTPQVNSWCGNWIEFWRDHRLGFQLQLASRKGYGGSLQSKGEKLLDTFHQLIDHEPQPSLLHGDLWGGNFSYDSDGNPLIFDPAVYYGDREADLAMTELFGGFGNDFYHGYNRAWPVDPGYKVRKTLYNLYHILNHLNLFGSGYLGQAEGMIERLNAELA